MGAWLKRARYVANLRAPEVAEALGYSSAQYIYNWEKERSCPPKKVWEALARLYKVDVYEIQAYVVTFKTKRMREKYSGDSEGRDKGSTNGQDRSDSSVNGGGEDQLSIRGRDASDSDADADDSRAAKTVNNWEWAKVKR